MHSKEKWVLLKLTASSFLFYNVLKRIQQSVFMGDLFLSSPHCKIPLHSVTHSGRLLKCSPEASLELCNYASYGILEKTQCPLKAIFKTVGSNFSSSWHILRRLEVLFTNKILYFSFQFLSYPEEQSMRLQTIVVRVARLTAPATSGMPLQVSWLVNHVSNVSLSSVFKRCFLKKCFENSIKCL